MAGLSLSGISKHFGARTALDDVSLDVADGEFVALLGPSGCGKTTLLRLLAGFERPDAGSLRIGDAIVATPQAHSPPEARNVGIVFQSYALWPHMSVAENVAYGLRMKGVRGSERDRRVAAALELVDLPGYAPRRPAELSGGQRQRVALARCLVTEPAVVLLDEPLANLDPHLRGAMLDEFRRFHRRTRTTMIYVTHDQSEAMTLADRIAVMHAGRIVQAADPGTLYRCPATPQVARFIGEGDLIRVDVDPCGADLPPRISWADLPVPARHAPGDFPGVLAEACVRARDVRLAGAGEDGVPARVLARDYLGGRFRLRLSPEHDPDWPIHCEVDDDLAIQPGTRVRVRLRDAWLLPQPR